MSFQDAVAGPSGIQKECLFCKTDKNLEKIHKNDGFSVPKFICTGCQVEECFTIVKFADKIGIARADLMNQIQGMDFFKKLNVREGSNVSNVSFGYLELEKCGVCHEDIPRNTSAEQHNKDNHPPNTIDVCTIGCGKYIDTKLMNNHIQKCGKFCPYEGCQKIYHLMDEHFTYEHKPFFCPIVGCIQGFPPENIEQICTHIVETHLWRRVPQISPRKKPKTAENQPDVVAGPSGPTKTCSYCKKDKTECVIIRTRYRSGATSPNICLECREKEKLTVAKFIEAFKKDGHEVNMESIRKMPIFAPYKLAQASDVTDVTLGFWNLNKCSACRKHVEWSVPMRRHIQNEHPYLASSEELVECPHGCGLIVDRRGRHSEACIVKCTYPGCIDRSDKPSYPQNHAHFKEDHKLIFCPFRPCAMFCRPDKFEDLCNHIMEDHLSRLGQHFFPNRRKKIVEIDLVSSDDESEA